MLWLVWNPPVKGIRWLHRSLQSLLRFAAANDRWPPWGERIAPGNAGGHWVTLKVHLGTKWFDRAFSRKAWKHFASNTQFWHIPMGFWVKNSGKKSNWKMNWNRPMAMKDSSHPLFIEVHQLKWFEKVPDSLTFAVFEGLFGMRTEPECLFCLEHERETQIGRHSETYIFKAKHLVSHICRAQKSFIDAFVLIHRFWRVQCVAYLTPKWIKNISRGRYQIRGRHLNSENVPRLGKMWSMPGLNLNSRGHKLLVNCPYAT